MTPKFFVRKTEKNAGKEENSCNVNISPFSHIVLDYSLTATTTTTTTTTKPFKV